MKQKKIVKQILQACLDGDDVKLSELRKEEFKKIFKHKAQHKSFSTRWTVIKL